MEEKWRITGTSLESARLSTIAATFDPTDGFFLGGGKYVVRVLSRYEKDEPYSYED